MKMKPEARSQQTEAMRGDGARWRFGVPLACGLWLLACSAALAKPSQNDVFKSIEQSVGERTDFDYQPIILLAGAGGLVVLLLALINHHQKRAALPRKINHPGRLMKEVLRDVPLKPAEVRQLKILAESVQRQTGEPANPLMMLLCPSLLAKGLASRPAKLDKQTVAHIVRKMRSQ